jgi:hypothetical protein
MSMARLASKGDGPQGDPVRSIARQIAGRSSAAGCHSSRILQGEITSHLAGETTALMHMNIKYILSMAYLAQDSE